MGRNSGGGAGGGQGVPKAPKVKNPGGRDSSYKGSVKNVRDLVSVKDPNVYRELKEGISRFHSTLGVREREVKIATLSPRVMGVQMTNVASGKSAGVYLNSRYFDQKRGWIHDNLSKQMKDGWQTKTKKPVQHVVMHELGHALWNTALKSPAAQNASPEIHKLYKTWVKDRKKKGYGEYSKSNIDEFWAETTAKACRGDQDHYTRAVKAIVKKYKL